MDFKNLFSTKKEEDEGCFPNLTFTERLIGFGICCVLGIMSAIQAMLFKSYLSEPSWVSQLVILRNSQ